MWDCGACGCQAIAASLCACPVCGVSREEGGMPKATVDGGPSNAAAPADSHTAQQVLAAQQVPEPPGPRAPKAELVDHAVNVLGVDPGEAQQMTKPELAQVIADSVPSPPPAPGA